MHIKKYNTFNTYSKTVFDNPVSDLHRFLLVLFLSFLIWSAEISNEE